MKSVHLMDAVYVRQTVETTAPSIAAAEKMGFVREGVLRWWWVLPPGKEANAVEEGRGEGDGRDSVVLSLCWDRWVSGVRNAVVERMARV